MAGNGVRVRDFRCDDGGDGCCDVERPSILIVIRRTKEGPIGSQARRRLSLPKGRREVLLHLIDSGDYPVKGDVLS